MIYNNYIYKNLPAGAVKGGLKSLPLLPAAALGFVFSLIDGVPFNGVLLAFDFDIPDGSPIS